MSRRAVEAAGSARVIVICPCESLHGPRLIHRIIVGTMVRDGYIYGLSLLAVAAVLVWATGAWVWSIAPVLLAAFFLWFFRDPQRTFPPGEG